MNFGQVFSQIHRYFLLYIAACVLYLGSIPVNAVVVPITSANLDSVLSGADVVFVNFYADWCRFSQMLTPVFEETSNKFSDPKVVFGSVDCDREVGVAQKYNINKYPTLKLFRAGQLAKREYRGQRSVESLEEYVKSQLIQPIKEFGSDQELESKIDKGKRNIIAYFTAKEGEEYENVIKVSMNLREECDFWFGIGEAFKQQTMGGNNIAFRPQRTENEDQLFTGDLKNQEYVAQWITDKCIPLVREITFENAEELTEEGLPFLILFRHPDDNTIVDTYTKEVAGQLADQKTAMNFLIADGKKFAHPLHHLGKSEKDLPVLAIDSFRHMYLYPDMSKLTEPGVLRQFVMDLHSGKLHREFHHGPDPTQTQPPQPKQPGQAQDQQPADGGGAPAAPGHMPPGAQAPGQDKKTTPPVSVFEKLKPSRNRYTILGKDEL
jgi:endoplasmic reticulum resident protein 44